MKLQQLIEQYVKYRQALGENFATNERILSAFGRRLGKSAKPDDVTGEDVRRFIDGSGPFTSARRKRYDALLGFYQYALSRGHITTNPLPRETPQTPPRFVPYLYTREEIRRLLLATGTYPFATLCEPTTARTILLLLYGSGVRISEALGLNVADVDFEQGVMTIRETKFYKSRLVPLGEQLRQGLVCYHAAKHPAVKQSAQLPLFLSRTGVRLNQNTFTTLFRRLCNHAGICRQDKARYQPRLHDLRHTFAVHRLTSWYQQGADVQRLLPNWTAPLF